jgi:replication factor C subunit 3/5
MISTNSQNKENIPWVEKYRPTQFDDIVLDPINRRIFENILQKDYFPNLMFYGPPGTGKTTTIINLINEYQVRHNQVNKGSVIHLNASDERGIDIIRNQIYQFVKSKNFFEKGLKFVILDEVDYMTKNAQQALKYLLQSSCYNVRFCLICNYISKIDESLKNEFICIRFNQLPRQDIFKFIKQIANSENLELKDSVIDTIQKLYNSDVRSMINFIQLNQNISDWESNIITDEIWEKIHMLLFENKDSVNGSSIIFEYINSISIQYNVDKKTIIKNYFNYVIRNKKELVNSDLLNIIEGAMHVTDSNIQHILQYFINQLCELYKSKN